MPNVPYAAYLRVYEPLAAFPEPERSYWARYARAERLPSAQDEANRALRDLLAVPARVAPERESGDAFVAEVDGVLCVCPWRTRLRAWEALGEVEHWLMPQSVLDAAQPPAARQGAADAYAAWRERNPDARPWIRSALWHVPVRWFALFDDAERVFTPAGRPQPSGSGGSASGEGGSGGSEESGGAGGAGGSGAAGQAPTLTYRTPMVQSRRRVARALRTVRRSMEDSPLAEALTDVGRWLEEFHPRSLVELDYAGLTYTISEERLAEDHSAADVAAGLAALAEGDLERAGRLYEELTDRWMTVRERQFAN